MWPILKSIFRHAFLTPKRRGFPDEWAVTIVVLLASATALQAFVIASGSMEGTLLVGWSSARSEFRATGCGSITSASS